MLGGIAIAVILIVLFPIVVIMSCAGIAAGLGSFLKFDAEKRNEGSELIELNR